MTTATRREGRAGEFETEDPGGQGEEREGARLVGLAGWLAGRSARNSLEEGLIARKISDTSV